MRRSIPLYSLFTVVVFCSAAFSFADETPFLERTITIQLQGERMDAALKKIALQGGFTFSYNSLIIDPGKVVSESFNRETIREILDRLFKGAIQYKERGRYVILTPAKPGESKKERIVSGYIQDETTGERLKNVSVYDPVSLSSAVTDSYGYFEIELDDPMANVTLVVNKQNYSDTLLVVPPDELRLLKIQIKNSKEKITTLADSVGKKLQRFWRTKVMAQDINMLNISDTLYRKVQFSVFPFIGTNHKLSGNVINDYSLNLYGGYSLGTRKLEFGGLFNIDRGNVSGGQIGGLFNTVGGDVHGVQFAGLINTVRGKTNGAQFAGLINFDWGDSEDFAMAGLINFARHESKGVKFAGLLNTSIGTQKGWHSAGLANFALRKVSGVQSAGLYNVTVDSVSGVQVAGLFNAAVRRVHGAQLSGLVNYTRRLKGVQVGLINIADSVQGVQFGLLSFAWKGYHTVEISADEIFYTNLAFRTGTRKFYNIFTAGMKPDTADEEETTWSFGYGIGTLPRINRWLYFNADLTANQVVKGKIEAINMINKLYLGVDMRAAKKLSFTIGATLNAHVTDNEYDHYPELFSDYNPKIFSSHNTNDNLNWQWWWGAKIGVRFL